MIRYLSKNREAEAATEESLEAEMRELPKEIFQIALLNPETGIAYCGDAEAYMEALGIYYHSMKAKEKQLETHLDNEDLEAYTLTVHSLKSTSMAIGAEKIFETAKELEQEGKRGNLEKIRKETGELLRMYRELRESLADMVEKQISE